MLTAPKGTPLYEEATKFLGHPPTVKQKDPFSPRELDKEEFNKIKKELIDPKIRAAMAKPEFKAHVATARKELETELALGRKAGILVFQAAGNDHIIASGAGDASMSTGITTGTKGLITVGGVDIGKPGHEDDTIYKKSSEGAVQISAPGINVPVGVGRPNALKPKDLEGTSFASPIAAETAYAMSAANPNLSADEIAKLITDPRASHDIAGTTRDGQGHIDQFAAVVLAKNPKLSGAQIDALRVALDKPKADVSALKKAYGLQ